MTAEILAELRARHIRLIVEGEHLVIDGPEDAIDERLIAELHERKREIIDALTRPTVTDDEVAVEAEYGRITCLRCEHLNPSGVCLAKSAGETKYRPLAYQPVALWRRCADYAQRVPA